MRRWHPLNQSLYFGYKVISPGLLLNSKGDRVAMHSSVETRYPFLDEDVIAFLAARTRAGSCAACATSTCCGMSAARWLPREIACRRKAMFRAPLDSFLGQRAAVRRPAAEPRVAAQDRLLRSRDRRPRLRAHRLRSGKQGRRVQAAGPDRRRLDAALAPPLLRRRPLRPAQPVAGSASRAPGSLIRPPTQSQV